MRIGRAAAAARFSCRDLGPGCSWARRPARTTVTSRPTPVRDGRLLARHEGTEAVARELVRGDVIPDVAGRGALGQQVSDHVVELPLRSRDLLVPMQERGERGVLVAVGLL
jgi:hypothetical protein